MYVGFFFFFFRASTLCDPVNDHLLLADGMCQVVYDIEGFLEKNNDSLHDNLLDLLDTTDDPFLRSVIDFVDPEAGSECVLNRVPLLRCCVVRPYAVGIN